VEKRESIVIKMNLAICWTPCSLSWAYM